MKKCLSLFLLTFAIALLISMQPSIAQCDQGVTPVFIVGNPDAADLGFDFGFKPQPEPPLSDTYTFPAPDGVNTVTITSDGVYFDWTSTLSIDAVIVKGGPNANVYYYDPEVNCDNGLHSPINPNNGNPYAISHIEFCYDYEVDVSKNATTSFTRTYEWDIDKSCDGESELLLSPGQTYDYPFSWTASVVGHTDDSWAVNGTITIDNNTPFNATIESVVDVITPGNIVAATDCGASFPINLTAGNSLTCSYSSSLPDGSDRTNTATVTTSGIVGGGTATADVIFGDPTTEVDACITVSDDCNSNIEVCLDDLDENDEYTPPDGYTCPIVYNECGNYIYTNTASFETNDQGLTGSDYCEVPVTVPCEGEGCTLTPGYWKTHSDYGPAPYDDNWEQLKNGADTPFFLSGQSYYEVLWTAPEGNAYYILAFAYIAAELNQLNGASIPTEVLNAFDAATDLFEAYTPADIAGLHGHQGDREYFISYAETLDDYNNGITGPGHCDEDGEPVTPPKLNQTGDNNLPEIEMIIPDTYELKQNYPNPFNPVTTISFGLPNTAHVTLTVYDVLGKEIVTLVNETREAGTYSVQFDASNIPSGIYFYKMQADKPDESAFIKIKKMILLK
jgi:hypothetical protein